VAFAAGPGLACGLFALGVGLLAAVQPARAQVSGSLTLSSDYRLRGFSLTEGRPALSLGVAVDDPSGVYFGGAVIAHDPQDGAPRILGHTEYLGYARRLGDGGPALDVGFASVDMSLYGDPKRPVQYQQVYVGLAQGAVSGRVSWSPDYPRRHVDTAYLDLNAAIRPAEKWRLSGHVGVTERLGGTDAIDGKSPRYDLRVALARLFARSELQVAWTGLTPRPRPHNRRNESGLTVSASVFF
jgi:uncharacterized protein (TIGR02001 family)